MIMNLSTTNDSMNADNSNILFTKENMKPENMKINLIEKDKKILDFMQQEKNLVNIINELKSTLEKKDMEITELIQEKKELEYNLNKKENLMNQCNEKYLKENNVLKNRIINYQEEIEILKEKILNKENLIKSYDENKKETYVQHNKKNNEIYELINQIKKNEELLKNMKLKEKEIIEENKKIPGLKRKINDLENVIKQYKNEIIELREHNEKIKNEKENLNDVINIKTNEIQKEKVNEQYVIRLNYKIDYLSKELNNMNIENEILNNQNISLNNDLNQFFSIFSKELNNYLNYLESLNIFSKSLHKMPLSILPNFENINKNDKYITKYENLGKIIIKIEEKIIDILNKNIEKNQDVFIDIINKENNYKELLNEKDELSKNKIELENNIICLTNEINKYKTELQIFKKDYNKIKNEFSEIKNKNKDLTLKNKTLKQQLNDFISDIKNQLKNFPTMHQNKNKKDKNTKNEIIDQINSLIILNKELNEQLKNMELERNKYKEELNKTFKDNSSLKSELSSKNEEKKNLGNEIVQIKTEYENELINQKKILYEKIRKLNNLLEESNSIIKSYEKEVQALKERNNKLENNLKILSSSHSELEKIINTNTTGLKNQLDIKEQKYNDILKELSIKDIHIKSLEKLIETQNKPIPGKIFTQIEAIPVNYEQNNINEFNTILNKEENEGFCRNKYDELKLNKLINGFEINNKVNNFLENEKIGQKNYVDINDLVKLSGGKN